MDNDNVSVVDNIGIHIVPNTVLVNVRDGHISDVALTKQVIKNEGSRGNVEVIYMAEVAVSVRLALIIEVKIGIVGVVA